MTALARLGLGTAQFGLDYGISNRLGRPDEREVAAILARAVEVGVGYIDTAPAYGEAEALLGRYLPRGHAFRIVTKTPTLAVTTIEARHGRQILDHLAVSLNRMKVDAVHAVLLHQPGDLAKPGWQHVVEALTEARSRGWARRIGASIYNSDQLSLVESRFKPELIQLPFNALDRRPIASGTLARLKTANVDIHTRSVFLQGLLLMKPDELPEYFAPVRARIVGLQNMWRERGLSAVQGCLLFVLQHADVDAVIVGINRLDELTQINAAIASSAGADFELAPGPSIDPAYLEPSRWPDFVH